MMLQGACRRACRWSRRRAIFSFTILAAIARLWAATSMGGPAIAAPPERRPEPGRELFVVLHSSCKGDGFIAFEGEDDWLPLKKTEEKLVVVTWQDGIKIMTQPLDWGGNYQGMSCTRGRVSSQILGRVDLLVYGRNSNYALRPFRVGATIVPMPIEVTNISSRYGPPDYYDEQRAWCGGGFGIKGHCPSVATLGMTARGQTVTLSVKASGALVPGSGYTDTKRIDIIIGDNPKHTLTVVDRKDFTAGD